MNGWRRAPRGARDRPTAKVIIARFGTWNAAIRAAGYEPRVQGDQPGELCKRGLHALVGDNVWQSPTRPGLRICRTCRRERRELRARDRERAASRERGRAHYKQLAAAGLCPRCGRDEPKPGHVCCASCLEQLRATERRRRAAAA